MCCVTVNNLQQKCAFPNSFEKVESGGAKAERLGGKQMGSNLNKKLRSAAYVETTACQGGQRRKKQQTPNVQWQNQRSDT
jgi:hypothetical protein